ncbi:MAG: DUF1580 domain-containing protein [Pirellulaceae bacterium]|nr:DUF1580 domain-containing protein [Pirellulaceae bacterium]
MMTIDDTYVPLKDAPKFLPTRPHFATVFRWATKGVRGVTLETLIVGGQRFTTERAIQQFLAALNGRPVESRSDRAKQLSETEKELDAELGE